MKQFSLDGGEELLLKVAGISAAFIAIFSAFTFYKNNIWHPKVEVVSVDYKNGVAKILINGKPFLLKGDSSYLISYDWGIKFGYTFKGNGERIYDRIEILKGNMVHSVIKKAEGVEEMGFVGEDGDFWINNLGFK
jgi:hypothetical protein